VRSTFLIYSVTFSLSGFSTVKRDGIELSGDFVATVNGDLDAPTNYNNSYVPNGAWLIPTAIQPARYLRLNATIDF
jgi:hypothetical protein